MFSPKADQQVRCCIIFIAIFLFNQGCIADGGARQYVDFSVTRVQKTLAVISKAEVQKDLKLTTNQLAKIAFFRQQRPSDIPTLANLLKQAKASDKASRMKIEVEARKGADEYLLNSISGVLTADQSKRLQEIMWQVDGLKLLHTNHQLVTALGLSDEQLGLVKDVFAYYDPILSPLYPRLGRQMIAGLSADETLQDRNERAKSLAGAIATIEKERDRDLYAILTPAQKTNWRDMTGRPLQIEWDTELF